MKSKVLVAGAALALLITAVTYYGGRYYTGLVRAIDTECERLWSPQKLRQAEARQLGQAHDRLMALLERANQALDGPCIPLSMPATDQLKELEAKRIGAQKVARLLSPAGYVMAACVLLISVLQWIANALRRRSVQVSPRITMDL